LLSDLWQRQFSRRSYSRDNQTVLLFYGPDVDTSRSEFVDTADTVHGDVVPSLSYVVGPTLIESLPLSGRDVYQLIALQPGVTSDLATLRGVGVSVNGQRPSSGSFLLDVDNNNYLISGPYSLCHRSHRRLQDFDQQFSAEYGRTSGCPANAATRRRRAVAWTRYAHLMNEALNANDAGRKQRNQQRLPLRDSTRFSHGWTVAPQSAIEFILLEYWRNRARATT
jgi:hypothetical protein